MSDFERIYYQLNIRLLSPLSVGSGLSEDTDHDVMVDGGGSPLIPATGIAGVLRSYIGGAEAVELFGKIAEDKNDVSVDSKIRVYDAHCVKGGKDYITNRDFVKLKNKVSVKSAKFDSQVVETGAEFVSYCELLDSKYKDCLENAFAALNSGVAGFGAKTSRGFGRVALTVKRREFTDIAGWLDFKMFEQAEWEEEEPISLNAAAADKAALHVALRVSGGLSVREYSTGVDMPDYKTLTLKKQEEYAPVIPGTSWAGAFRERCAQVLTADEMVRWFGDVDEKNGTAVKSQVIFSESMITGGKAKNVTRNSIDRFSGATKSGALYTEQTSYFGETSLDIAVPRDERLLCALGVCLADLHNGFLAVGGLTSVGRGLFRVESVAADGKDLTGLLTGDTVDIKKFAEEAAKHD